MHRVLHLRYKVMLCEKEQKRRKSENSPEEEREATENKKLSKVWDHFKLKRKKKKKSVVKQRQPTTVLKTCPLHVLSSSSLHFHMEQI